MAFEAHHFTACRREPKRSWTKRHRAEAKVEARARTAGNITAVLYERSDVLEQITDEKRLVNYLDGWFVLSHELFPYKKERRYIIARIVQKMIAAGEIVVGQKGDYWLPSQIDAQVLFDRLRAELESSDTTSLKQANIAFLASRSNPLAVA